MRLCTSVLHFEAGMPNCQQPRDTSRCRPVRGTCDTAGERCSPIRSCSARCCRSSQRQPNWPAQHGRLAAPHAVSAC